jgi:hypothetical protein
MIYAGLGAKDRVLEWLEKGYEDRSTPMAYLKVNPILNEDRSGPRFVTVAQTQALLAGIGFSL